MKHLLFSILLFTFTSSNNNSQHAKPDSIRVEVKKTVIDTTVYDVPINTDIEKSAEQAKIIKIESKKLYKESLELQKQAEYILLKDNIENAFKRLETCNKVE